MPRPFLLSALTLALTLALSQAADWTRFRGPNGTGVADGPLPPIDPKNPLWKIEIGKGNGSPIIVKGKLLLQTASNDGKKRSLVCLDAATGKQLWAKDVPGSTAPTHNLNSLASSTPASDGESVYCVFWDGAAVAVHAFDLDGKEKWSQSLGSYNSQHGVGHSPMVHNGKVFVNFDQDAVDKKTKKPTTDKPAVVVALDAKTGNRVWEQKREAEAASYTTPYLLEQPGKPAELIVGTTTAIDSYDPDTGKVNWHYAVEWSGAKLRMIGCPIFAGGVLVFYSGEGGGARYAVAVRPGGTGDVTKTAKAWELKKFSPYATSMVAKGDLLFWVDDGGRAMCAEAKTGKLLWDGTDAAISGAVYSSPILAGNEILVIGEKGTAVVLKADKEYEVVKKVEFGEGVIATPALVDGKLYVRTAGHLYCFGKK